MPPESSSTETLDIYARNSRLNKELQSRALAASMDVAHAGNSEAFKRRIALRSLAIPGLNVAGVSVPK